MNFFQSLLATSLVCFKEILEPEYHKGTKYILPGIFDIILNFI